MRDQLESSLEFITPSLADHIVQKIPEMMTVVLAKSFYDKALSWQWC